MKTTQADLDFVLSKRRFSATVIWFNIVGTAFAALNYSLLGLTLFSFILCWMSAEYIMLTAVANLVAAKKRS